MGFVLTGLVVGSLWGVADDLRLFCSGPADVGPGTLVS